MRNLSSWKLCLWLYKNYILHYKKTIALAVFFMIGQALATTGVAKIIEPITNGMISKDISLHYWTCFLLAMIYLIKALTNYGQTFYMGWISQRIIADMRKGLFAHIIKMDLAYFQALHSGQIISYFTNDINKVNLAVSRVLITLGRDLFIVVGLAALMFYQDAFLATIFFVSFPAAVTLIVLLGKRMRKTSHMQQNVFGDMTSSLSQIFQGIRNVKAYSNEAFEIKRNFSLVENLFKIGVKTSRIHALSQPIMEVLGGLTAAAALAYGGYQVHQGTLSIGIFISFIACMLMLYPAAKSLSRVNIYIQEGLAAAQRILNILNENPLIVNSPQAEISKFTKTKIEFRDISFSYDKSQSKIDKDSKEVALDKISFIVPSRKKIALVGPSGAGKTTILNLLLRFYDPQNGRILIDNKDIRNSDIRSLRKHFALVSQDIILLDDTIYNNIAYGNMKASEKDIYKAAKNAAADEFIVKLPESYHTKIGENGVRLSGGQKQRIAIARAFLRNAPILLLDEATSALDTKSEKLIHKALENLSENKTTIMIAHRLSTIELADIIIVFEKGKIIEIGSHDELLKMKGLYYELYQNQLGKNKQIL